MRRTHLYWLGLSAVLVVAVVFAGANLPGGSLVAMQQSSPSGSARGMNAQGQSGNTGATGSGSSSGSYNGSEASGTAPGATGNNTGNSTSNSSDMQGTQGDHNLKPGPGNTQTRNTGAGPAAPETVGSPTYNGRGNVNQAGSDVARAGAPWGWIIGSFVVGFVAAGIIFSGRRRTDYTDRDDIRRAA